MLLLLAAAMFFFAAAAARSAPSDTMSVGYTTVGVWHPTPHTSGEIRSAAQSWVDRGMPYEQLTPDSRRLVSRGTWAAWVRCGDENVTATVRGHGNDLAVVRWTYPDGNRAEWTAYWRGGQWQFELPGVDVNYLHAHTAAEVARCA